MSNHFSKQNIIGFRKQVKMRNNIQIMDAKNRILRGPSLDLGEINKHNLKS